MRFSIISLLFPFTANALSAMTVNTIQGTKPYTLLSDGTTKLMKLEELLGFSMWDGTYNGDGSKHMVQIDSTKSITAGSIALNAPAEMKLSDVITLVMADGTTRNMAGVLVGDSDGDADIVANTSVSGTMKAVWSTGGKQVPNLNRTLSACGDDYTLEISATNVQANTTYGDPKIHNYGSSTPITYTFTPNGKGICYLKPASMQIYTGTAGVNIKYANGYNDSVFDTTNGFKANSDFPTTGFYKAVFSLIGSGSDQSKYRCNTTSSAITLSGVASTALGANCMVTYNTVEKPISPMVINMEYNDSGTWTQIDSFTIPVPSKWAIGKGLLAYGNTASLGSSTSFPVLDVCRTVGSNADNGTTIWLQGAGQDATDKAFRQMYMYRREELANNPYVNPANYPEGTGAMGGGLGGYFSRDIGTFMSEWGDVYTKYSGSSWSSVWIYWTAETHSTVNQYVISSNGGVGSNVPTGTGMLYGAICRGE